MDILSAKNNEKVKLAAGIRDSARARRENGMFFLEGARLCSDAAESGTEIFRAFLSRRALERYPEKCERIISASEEVYEISAEVASTERYGQEG